MSPDPDRSRSRSAPVAYTILNTILSSALAFICQRALSGCALERDPQRGPWSAPFEDRLGREMEGLPLGYPTLDVVQASFPTPA